jgi:hypothetical protein
MEKKQLLFTFQTTATYMVSGQGKTKGTGKETRRIEQIPEHIKRLENTR